MDPHEREAAGAAEGMAEVYGGRLPRIGELAWFKRPVGEPDGVTCGEVVEVLGTLTPDPILVVRRTLTDSSVIRASRLVPAPDFSGRVK